MTITDDVPVWVDCYRGTTPPGFRSRLRPLSILDLERMTPAQLQRREHAEEERRAWLGAQRQKRATRPEQAPVSHKGDASR
jgi:hypothetical protein